MAKVGSGSGDGEDAAARGEELVFDVSGAGVEDLGSGRFGGRDAGDGVSGADLGGISVGGEDDAEGWLRAPLKGGVC